MAADHVPGQAYSAVAAEFSPAEIAALVSVSTRTWEPGSYQP